jgi:plastocyanin
MWNSREKRMRRWITKWTASGLGLGAALILAAGCGGSGESVDTATVTLPEPVATTASPAGGGEVAPTPSPGDTTSAGGKTSAPEAAVKAEGFGTLKGRVTFAGDPPAPKNLVNAGDTSVKDAAVCAANPIPSQRLVVDPATKGVRYALVYIPRPTAVSPEAVSAAKASNVEFDQKNCVFEPHVLAVMKGVPVNIKSSDPVGHNVHFMLTNLTKNTSIQPGSPPLVETPKADEKRPGPVVCDIHPWMKAWWMVLNNPYYAVTDEQGNYEIKDVPAGTQKVVVWQEAVHPDFVTAASGDPVTIQANGETVQDFVIQPAKVKPEG